MKKIDLGQTVNTLANIGVIAGIVFLGFELRQNNQFLAAEARTNLITQRSAAFDLIANLNALDVLHRYAAGEDLTPAERSLALMTGLKQLELWEWQYGEYAAGMLELEQIPIEAWRIWYSGDGEFPSSVREVWQSRKQAMNPDFVEFMNRNVVDDP